METCFREATRLHLYEVINSAIFLKSSVNRYSFTAILGFFGFLTESDRMVLVNRRDQSGSGNSQPFTAPSLTHSHRARTFIINIPPQYCVSCM